jgi:CRP-like cAMP-binding protein
MRSLGRKGDTVLQYGERTNGDGRSVSNHILLAISDAEYGVLRPHLKLVDLPHHASLHEPNEKLVFAYFPNQGLVSLVVATKEGRTVEVGVVGNEGMVGTPAAVGLNRSPHRAIVQIAGKGFRIGVEVMAKILPSAPQLQMLTNRYAVVQGMQAAQTAACNRLHGVEQRLSRWLLIMQDRLDSGLLPITHDFLATMLGTDRPSVSLAAGLLQRKKLIACTRGAVQILNRKSLEQAACECYGVIQQFNGTLGLNNR